MIEGMGVMYLWESCDREARTDTELSLRHGLQPVGLWWDRFQSLLNRASARGAHLNTTICVALRAEVVGGQERFGQRRDQYEQHHVPP